MKKNLIFSLLLIFTALFTTTFVLAQIQTKYMLQIPYDGMMNARFQTINNNDGRMNLGERSSQNTKNQQNLPDRVFKNNPRENLKNGDALIYEYDSIYLYKSANNFLREFATRDASGKPLTTL